MSAFDRWFVPARGTVQEPAAAAEMALFAFPPVGGGGTAYRALATHLPPTLPLWCARLPGRERRIGEPPVDDPDVLLDALTSVLAPRLGAPFALLGQCAGALLAFALAERLAERGMPSPVALFVLASRAPGDEGQHGDILESSSEQLWDELVALRAVPPQVAQSAEMRALLEPMLRADYTLARRCGERPPVPLDLPIAVIGGRRDERLAAEQLTRWEDCTTTELSVSFVDGGHRVADDASAAVAAIVRRVSERLVPRAPTRPPARRA